MGEVIKNSNFRKLFLSNLFSGVGQGMTMIGISWYMIELTGTARLLGSTMIISAILTLLIGPFAGTMIDRFSRKAILQFEQLAGFTVLLTVSVWGWLGTYSEWMMVFIYLSSIFIFYMHESAQSAFVQEIFEPKLYGSINSFLEIENQTALVLSGALAGILLEKFGLHVVLILNALGYLLAFLNLLGINYVSTSKEKLKLDTRNSWLSMFNESWRFIKRRRGLMIFGVAALIPFITVMLVNLLNPIFVSHSLKADVKIYSLGEVTYSIGALISGVCTTIITRKMSSSSYMVANYFMMIVALILTVTFPKAGIFLLCSALIGWCNVSTRLIRQNMYMELLPNHLIGRVLSFFKSIGTLLRLLLLALFTIIIDLNGVSVGYFILAGILSVATIGIFLSFRLLLKEID
ncbi:MFS transporter [Heyndrickxia oleronia]|uniref:MFS transporter n=1 Tax=Heyndrickxia oleronia TaxID=38875 RepID=A0A8E2I5U1_9BACI|nr:MFS transporter [Heyndrickxia oleronia]MCM3457199.1 MFS transporter [Heyndrickxia oleronia]MEC1377438.1 MFS transporter [Heyndrickxia oleronia]OOP67271.1 MFS transporter [Heyndrickxia oleronia]QQZ02899.1 MFS transporter [Heyndrickxia oleronia]